MNVDVDVIFILVSRPLFHTSTVLVIALIPGMLLKIYRTVGIHFDHSFVSQRACYVPNVTLDVMSSPVVLFRRKVSSR
jgi:hypothetical protein